MRRNGEEINRSAVASGQPPYAENPSHIFSLADTERAHRRDYHRTVKAATRVGTYRAAIDFK